MLKHWVVFGCVGIAFVLALTMWLKPDRDVASPRTSSSAEVGVEALMRNVDSHRAGTITVRGVVSAVDVENQALALIDLAEAEQCGVANCAALTLPVRWTGPMPQEKEAVRIQSGIRDVDGKLVFVARTVEAIQPASEAF